ncbi:MAG TPA: hypothetical protein VE441_01850 [Mycobacterium sp.]|nr:hypothetical protein [Mycobacterium sp.]
MRRAAAGDAIIVSIDGRPTAQLGPLAPRQWWRAADLAAIFTVSAESNWTTDDDFVDQIVSDPCTRCAPAPDTTAAPPQPARRNNPAVAVRDRARPIDTEVTVDPGYFASARYCSRSVVPACSAAEMKRPVMPTEATHIADVTRLPRRPSVHLPAYGC